MENYQKVLSNGESFSIPIDGVGINVETIAAATTLTAVDCGKSLILSAAAGAVITLPALKSGLKFKFIVGAAFATTAWTIVSSTNVIQGSVIVNGAHVAGSDENTITFAHAAESIGDWATVECDGTNWYVNGSGVTAASITLTAA